MGQLSFYSADAHPCALSDLEGVLCGRGQVVVFGRGTTARLSVILGAPPPPPEEDEEDEKDEEVGAEAAGSHPAEVAADEPAPDEPAPAADDDPDAARALDPDDLEFLDLDPEELAAVLAPTTVPARGSRRPVTSGANALADPSPLPPPVVAPVVLAPADPVAEWRARQLRDAFRTRGVDAELARAPDGRPVVRSAFRADLTGLAQRWTRGAVKAVPDGLELDGPRLRHWVLSAGRRAGHAYVLGLDPHAEHTHAPLLAASHRAGLGATLGVSRQEPCLRIIGRRRQGRLGELVGDPPRDLAADVWPE